MTNPRYATPQAFKQALEQRLRTESTSGVDIARRRQLLVFERFLARVQREAGDVIEKITSDILEELAEEGSGLQPKLDVQEDIARHRETFELSSPAPG